MKSETLKLNLKNTANLRILQA